MRWTGALLLCAALAGCGGSAEITRLQDAVAGLRHALAREADMNTVSQALVQVRLARDHARSSRQLTRSGDIAVTDLLQTGVLALTAWAGGQVCGGAPVDACLQPVSATSSVVETGALLDAVDRKAAAALDTLD